LVEETREPGENHRPATSHWQTLSHYYKVELRLIDWLIFNANIILAISWREHIWYINFLESLNTLYLYSNVKIQLLLYECINISQSIASVILGYLCDIPGMGNPCVNGGTCIPLSERSLYYWFHRESVPE
jgi:hypothetical protein